MPTRPQAPAKAEPEKSKQRPYKIGGKTNGPELYDSGLSATEEAYIQEGKIEALTGAAKLRAKFTYGRGF